MLEGLKSDKLNYPLTIHRFEGILLVGIVCFAPILYARYVSLVYFSLILILKYIKILADFLQRIAIFTTFAVVKNIVLSVLLITNVKICKI